MTADDQVRLLALAAALVLPVTAVMRRRQLGSSTGRLVLLWIGIIGLAWLVASAAPYLSQLFT